MGIIEQAEMFFRQTACDKSILRNIPTVTICESTLSSPVVKSLWENIVLESGIESQFGSTQKLCLENVVKLYIRVRSFSYARDYTTKYKIKKKQGKSKALRMELKRR